MRPPEGLDEAERRLWRRTVRYLEDLGVWRPCDAAAVERYVRAAGMARRMRGLSDAEPIIRGSHRQLMIHPAARLARQLEEDAHAYAESLLLTPRARKRAGLPMGEPEDTSKWAHRYGFIE